MALKVLAALAFAVVWYLIIKYCLDEIDDGYEIRDEDR